MTGKKLTLHHYINLIDRILGRITHWSASLLNYAGRIQLLKSVTFDVMNYWMQCFPFPKFVIHKIDAIFRTFMWTGGTELSRKSHIAWKPVCKPKSQGGLNMINLEVWNKTNLVRLLWNLNGKSDSLWVKWAHTYLLPETTTFDGCRSEEQLLLDY